MSNKYFLLLVVLLNIIYIPITNAYGICTCLCCSGAGCELRPVGTADVPVCDQLNCLNACKAYFPQECNDPTTSEVSVSCQEMNTTTISPITTSTSTVTSTTVTISTTTTQLTTPPTPWPTSTSTSASSTTTISTASTPQTSSTTSSTPLTPTSTTTTTTTTESQKPTTTTYNGVGFLRQSSSVMASLITSVLLITKIIF